MNRLFPRYFKRLFLNGLFFGLLPLVFTGVCLYIYAYHVMRDNILEINDQFSNQIKIRVEETMRRQDRHLLFFITENTTAELLRTQSLSNDKFQLFAIVSSNMARLLSYDRGIFSTILVNLQDNWILSDAGVKTLENNSFGAYLENLYPVHSGAYWYTDFDLKEELTLNNFDSWLNPKTVKFIRPFPLSGYPQGYAAISIPCSYFNEMIGSDELATDILLVDERGRIVANKNGSLNGLMLADSPYGGDIRMPSAENSGFIKRQQNTYLYSLSRSSYNGWMYVYIADNRHVLRAVHTLRNITMGMGFLIIIAVIVLAFSRARFFYRPIDRLYSRLAGNEDEKYIISTYRTNEDTDEFQAIDSRLDRMIGEHRKLEERVMRESEHGKELFVHHLINGKLSAELLSEKIKLYQFPQCPPRCRVALMWFQYQEEETAYEKRERDWIFIALSNIVTKMIPELLFFPTVVDGGSIVMILGSEKSEGEFKKQLVLQLEKLLDAVHGTIHVDGEICVSANADAYDRISECRAQANEMFKYQLWYSQNGLLFAEDLEELPVVYPPFPQHLEDAILDALRRGDTLETDAALNSFISFVTENENLKQRCSLTFARLLVDILRITQEYNLEELWPPKHGGFFEQLFTLRNRRQIFLWFKDNYIDPLLALIHNNVSQKEIRLVQKMKHIAETRYDEWLSVEIIAEELSSYPSFLRRVFKGRTGIGFNTYLMKCRMDAAKKMLEETDMLISDIAAQLTYQNAQNFIRTFHNEFGLAPGEYRKMRGKN
jgi:AraC-like DNA-binding protein